MDFSGARTIIAVFVMHGCGACDEYLPRFSTLAKERGLAVLRIDKGQKISLEASREMCLPVVVVNANSAQFAPWMDQLKISVTPTTCVMRRSRVIAKLEGNVSDVEIRTMLNAAMRSVSCEI